MMYSLFLLKFLVLANFVHAALQSENSPQSDVSAPAYVPAYARYNKYGTKSNYRGLKRSYSGTKTVSGTKTGYSGTKSGYGGTKTGGVKTGYAGTKTGSPGYGGYYGQTESSYEVFRDNAVNPYEPICEPDCKNNGICVATGVCNCPPNFYGNRCEFEKIPCMAYPPVPANAQRMCSSEMCTIKCDEGHEFIDGTSAANLRCIDGQWQPTRADLTSIPDCVPLCEPPCLNGGACLSLNTCQCPSEYRGPQCQYSVSDCDARKMSFNGAYSCSGNMDQFSCKVSCPQGSRYSSPPADIYTCLYSVGKYEPQPIPQCIFDDAVIIVSNDHHSYGEYNETYHETYEKSHESHSSYIHRHHGSEQTITLIDYSPKSGTCFTWGGTHYKTFDGKVYSFQSMCQHILMRDTKDHKYTVTVGQGKCKRQFYCPSEISVFLEDKQYFFSINDEGGVVFRNTRRLLPIPASLPGLRVSMPRDTVYIHLDGVGATVKWDTNNLVMVEASVSLWNNTEGLCGNLDGQEETDFVTRDGTVASTTLALASSWQINKIGESCESTPTSMSACKGQTSETIAKAEAFCASLLTREKFRKCYKVMDSTPLLEACQWDYCACVTNQSPEDCACNTIAVYAQECLRSGIEEMRSWRDAETCPMKCPGDKIYKACGPDAQPSCATPTTISDSDNSTCVEGCYCPEGLYLEEGLCVQKEQCPCRLRTKVFKPGSVVPKDCNTCTCEAGEWKCTQASCGARCGAVGDPHYTTFDGLKYDFMGHCTYNLLMADNLTIEVENVACSGAISEAMNLEPSGGQFGKPSCTKAVNLIYGGTSIHLKQGGFVLVNGKEISSLPLYVGEVCLRAASSLFIIVELPNDVDIWWDGNTRVFIDVPPAFRDRTKGLCGTFNQNQKDDFLTPEGDIEQTSLAFANKWKTREFCDDMAMTEPEHPCKSNVENKETAEKYCNKLKSKLFEECHWHVDVEPYYEECMYDMCACTGDVQGCLCPIIGDYAMTCAKNGVMVQWRYNVKECALNCGGGQEYTVCADSCQRTCSDVAIFSTSSRCKPTCVEGCACPTGLVLDANNQCVPIGLCPCIHKGLEFHPGYKEVRPGRRERELCTCVGAKWDCRPATPDEIQNYPPAEDLRMNCSAALHQEFTSCETAEPLTCKNMHLPPSFTTVECRPGCQCKRGYVLDTISKKCVMPTQCPCHHGGQSYPDGHVMQEECNTCECNRGNWTCTTRKCVGVCSAWGDSHFTTFDGKEYDFEGVCTYLMAKGVMETGKDGFDVEIQNVPCGTTGATCSKSITLKVGFGENVESVSLTKDAPLPDTSKLKRIQLRIAGAFVFLDVPSLAMSLQWDRAMRVYVKVDPMWENRLKGLCGNYNYDQRDDYQTPSGGGITESSALAFADSWKLKPTCPKTAEVKDHCQQRPERKEWAMSTCGAMKRYPFTMCHTEVPPTDYITKCERDACACDSGADCECACTALAAYAQLCASRGVEIKWRSQLLCPMQCDEECSTYDPCISACPLETCDNTLYYEEIKRSCEKDTCIEGCKPKKSCPQDTVYSNSSHIECIPRSQCKPVCMILENGKEVLEGEVLEEDACHTCRCSQKQRVCTGVPCSTAAPIITTAQPHITTVSPLLSTVESGRSTKKPVSENLITTFKPADEPLKCVTGWTPWISRYVPEPITATNSESIDKEPLPSPKELQIGSPMCEKNMIKKIECRTIDGHKAPKETGLNVECSLENGLLCRETNKDCLDFEIRVYCECEEEPFQCLNSIHPNHPHPSDCRMFYECTPDPMSPDHPHAVLKTCGEGLMYNPQAMVCDWPASVIAVRPECGEKPETTTTAETRVPSICPPGQVYSHCAYPCDKLCDHFLNQLQENGKCTIGEKCVSGCMDDEAAKIQCDYGSRWRDEHTCVPIKDCTCYSQQGVVKPGGVVINGCEKCQCLDNVYHCDLSIECIQTSTKPSERLVTVVTVGKIPSTAPTTTTLATTHTPSVTIPVTTSTPIPTSTRIPFTTPTPTTILVIQTTVTPPPECNPKRYKHLLWEDQEMPDSAFSASSIASELFAPQYAVLDGHPLDITAGSWNPAVMDTNQYIQVELPRREPIYGVIMQGSPLFDQYVTSYEVMYGDDGNVFSTVNGPDNKPKIFRGPIDHNTALKQMIEPPIEARYIRIRPLTWHEEIAVRFELIGCQEPLKTSTTEKPRDIQKPSSTISTKSPAEELFTTPGIGTRTTPEIPQCTDSIGLEAGLPIDNIEVSTNAEAVKYLDLKGEKGWTPLYSTPGEWILFDFTDLRQITGVRTKGGKNGWVSSYYIMYATNLTTFNPLLDESGQKRVFPANFDENTEVLNTFRPPIHARYLKVLPLKWHNTIELRIEPIGCYIPYPTEKPTTKKPVLTTIAPLPCIDPMGFQADLPIKNIEVSSNSEAVKYLDIKGDRGWSSLTNTPGEWILFDFTDLRNMTGVKTKGGKNGWVSSYYIMYAINLTTFIPVLDDNGQNRVFTANYDENSEVLNTFSPPIHARYLKVLPLRWHNCIEMRIEPIGCYIPYTTEKPTEEIRLLCIDPIGLEAGLPVGDIEVSSNPEATKYLGMKEERGWRPFTSSPGEWILFDFTDLRNITGVKTKGGKDGWVSSYYIMYATNLTTFNPLLDENGQNRVFSANSDENTEVLNTFSPPIHARYLKVLPVKWHNSIEMRIEPIGCYIPYPKEDQEGREPPCELCPGAHLPSDGKCPCAPPLYYDGEGCTERALCPCFISFMPYAVGATFRGTNCDECVCKLGGVTSCQPVKECKCAPDLVPELLTATCECTCEPCPEGTKICPTSHMCLRLESWCDGLMDCPDDEENCTTTTMATTPSVRLETTVAPATMTTALVTTEAPAQECPKVECPPGYIVRYTTRTPSHRSSGSSLSDLPPPRPRKTYRRYYRPAKGGSSSGGASKGGSSKGGSSGSNGGSYPNVPSTNQAFDLERPSVVNLPENTTQECQQFRCIPELPPYVGPGSTTPLPICSAPKCPPNYVLTLDTTADTNGPCPQYVCVPPPERLVFCNMTGRTFNTFDGSEYKYDICFHILARENRFNSWTVLVRKKCNVDSCLNELVVKQDDDLIVIKPNLMIEYDNYEYTYEQTSMICFQKNSFDISKLGNGLAISSRRYNFTVFYYSNGDVKVGVYKKYLGSVDGLCGTYDGDASNDRSLPNGDVVLSIDDFGRSWAKPGLPEDACHTRVIPPEEQRETWEICNAVSQPPFSECARVLNLDRWRGICLEKICECADLVINGTQRTREECRCELLEQFVAECLAADRNIDLSSWRVDLNCPVDCPPPLVHVDCFRKKCEPTCSTLGTATKQCPIEDGQCFPGCYCPEGKLRKGDDCVTPMECRDCICNGVGNPAKYVTFERDDLPFGGNCTYLAARDKNDTGHHKFEVYSTNGPCENSVGSVCTKIIHLVYEKNILHVQKNSNNNELEVILNENKVFKYPMKNEWIIISLVNGHDINLLVPDVQLEITVIQDKMEFTIKLPSYAYANKTEGLCGTCAGYSDELVMQNGTVTDDIDIYGNSWRATPEELKTLDVPEQDRCGEPEPECVTPPLDQDLCYNIFDVDRFGKCHALVDPTSFVESCQHEVCVNPDVDLCTILERYAAECRRADICLNWRTTDLCPYPCTGDLVYRPCVKCQPTCEDYERLAADPGKCDKPVTEGCYCPEDKVRVNNTCIEPSKCFPCDSEHYVGDAWQEDACKKCSCSKPSSKNEAHISCTVESCTTPVCADNEDLIEKPLEFGACCKKYSCVPKPKENVTCEEVKQIECGFGQVLKQRTTSNGCNEFVCECKPSSECDPLPSSNDVELLAPGMERVVDDGGCCPSARLVCRPELCPEPVACPALHKPVVKNVTGLCCPERSCELPTDKCVVTLKWEADAKGGEKPRATTETVLKDLDNMWWDGPCRSCRCELVAGVAAASCSHAECPAITSTEDMVMEPEAVPFVCCPRAVPVACRQGDNVYKVGENWTSPYNPCESYRCVAIGEGKLEKQTTVQQCESDCQPGWRYVPVDKESGVCCGKCRPFACVVDGVERPVGERWTSDDHCTNYTCSDVQGTLQVRTTNESCPEPSTALRKQFVFNEESVPGKCCKLYEPVACRVGNAIYQEGQTWASGDPCKNLTCGRDESRQLAITESVERCEVQCPLGWEYRPTTSADKCCGRCEQVACILDGEVKPIESVWTSEDNCTTYTCVNGTDSLWILSSMESCPDVSVCAPEERYTEGCCERCKIQSDNQKICSPEPVPANESVGLLRIHIGIHGICTNKHPIQGFKECVGRCDSGTVYNPMTGLHDSDCKCCQALRHEPLLVVLNCQDGTQQEHRVASPDQCQCSACQGSAAGKHPSKTGPSKGGPNPYQETPDIDARWGERRNLA